MRLVLVILLALSSPVLGADADNLAGTWKLVSWQVIVDNKAPQNVFGAQPKGFLILTRERRIMVTERAALHKSMVAYSGQYRVEGDELITRVDVSWNEEWNGTEQRRHFRIDGDKLFIESAPAPSIVFPSKTDFRRIVWEREK